MLENLLTLTGSGKTENDGGVYPNLFHPHPPFRIDGNFAAGAGISSVDTDAGPAISISPDVPGARTVNLPANRPVTLHIRLEVR